MTPDISPSSRAPGPPGPLGLGKQGVGTGVGTALALLGAVLVTGPACLLAVYLAPHSARPETAWGSGAAAVALCAAVTTAAYHLLTARTLRRALAAQHAAAEAVQTDTALFADVTVPALVERLRAGDSAETALATVPMAGDTAQRRVLTTLAGEVARSEAMRAAALSACANAAGRVQALTTSMAADLREMEHRHSDEEVLGDLLHLDHRTAQAGRLADSIAVLTGARSGRRWAKPIVMESVLRGAMGRISGYQRIRLHSTSTAAVAGHAAEGVMHALAELMDNAANFSPPTAEVHVYVEDVSAGIVVMVEDGGLAMSDMALRRAEEAVAPVNWELSARSGTRLGLPVVGRLARKHGLAVSFRPSAHGGTGVLLRIPPEVITRTGGRGAGARSRANATGADANTTASAKGAAVGATAKAADARTGTGTARATGPASDGHAPDEATGPRVDTDTVPVRLDAALRAAANATSIQAARRAAERAADADADTDDALEVPVGPRTADEPAPEHGNAAPDPDATGSEATAPDATGGADGADGAPPPASGGPAAPDVRYGESGLPKRQRGRTLASSRRPVGAAPPGRTPGEPRTADARAPHEGREEPGREARASRTPEESGSRFGAFRRAVREGARPDDTAAPRDSDGDGDGPDGAAHPSPAPSSPARSTPRPEEETE
ncbi:ATP-binding protein [Streptomyces sp. Z26]|uniref:ATP-binding protein n=1 Tax=Streptomyces sp. Z26 TaxID=2500177 RepID=UPI000EF1508D|nr:ATP-binding protein [Streptomyces sp. Z26]RLL68235.1 ATP-binding protein [Streptomyces sp. Z26]